MKSIWGIVLGKYYLDIIPKVWSMEENIERKTCRWPVLILTIRVLIMINMLKAPVEKVKNTHLLSITSTSMLKKNRCQSRNVFSNFAEMKKSRWEKYNGIYQSQTFH